MSRHQTLPERARGLVEKWPPGGLVVGLLPDPADPEWAGLAALALAFAAADRREPALILDLAPKETDLASRFGAADAVGVAELVDGEVELWEIVHRHASGNAFYLPCGLRTPGAELARSPTAASLADRVRRRGRIALVPLDRRGAGEAASAGWVDGFVRLGEKGVSSARLSAEAGVLGHLERRRDGEEAGTGAEPGTGSGEQEAAPRRGSGGRGPEEPRRDRAARSPERRESRSGMGLRRRRRSRAVLRRAGGALAAAAVLIAAGVTASTWLGGPGWQEVRDAAGTAAGRVGDAVPAGPGGPGSGADSASGSGADPGTPTTEDSAAPATGDTAAGGASRSGTTAFPSRSFRPSRPDPADRLRYRALLTRHLAPPP